MNFLLFREPLSAWTHFSWLLLSLPGTVLLWRLGRGDRAKQLCLLVYGLGLAACFAGSTLYHGVRLSEAGIASCQRLDQVGIYLLIAGSYTPASFVLLRGLWKWGSLALAWALAAAGIAMHLLTDRVPAQLATGLYLLLGWGIVLAYFELARRLSHRALVPAVLGGVFYSAGAVLNLLGWPVLCFTAHEFMHFLVMAGSLSHYWFMARAVAPFDRRAAANLAPAVPDAEADELDPAVALVRAQG
jgi:hemolysin III